jgi:YjbE family integral membrane protein
MEASELVALGSVIVIDIVLSGDNAIVIGMAAAGLPPDLQRRAILIGVAAATIMRVAFAAVALQLLTIIGLTLAGGLLLLWVAWKMWRELRDGNHGAEAAIEGDPAAVAAAGVPRKTLGAAMLQIVLADVSMSLDNVLAVAGAARDHFWVLVVGLALSIALMMVASTFIARLLNRHHWLAYVGLIIVAYVAVDMIWEGGHQVLEATDAL